MDVFVRTTDPQSNQVGGEQEIPRIARRCRGTRSRSSVQHLADRSKNLLLPMACCREKSARPDRKQKCNGVASQARTAAVPLQPGKSWQHLQGRREAE